MQDFYDRELEINRRYRLHNKLGEYAPEIGAPERSAAREIAGVIAGVIATIAAVDVFGFMAWIASGQHPADSFYIGTLTAHAIRWIAGL